MLINKCLNRKILKVHLHVRFQGTFICCSWEKYTQFLSIVVVNKDVLEWREKRKKESKRGKRDNIKKDETIGRKKREKERIKKKEGEIKIMEKGREKEKTDKDII